MTWIWVSLVLVLAVVLGLTARRLGETRARLARTEARLATVLEAWEAGLSVWDQDGHLVGWNPRFGEFYPQAPLKPGVVFEDLLRYTANRGLVQLAADDDDAIEAWVAERVARFGAAHSEVLRTAAGRWVDVVTRSAPGGEVLMVFADTTTLRDEVDVRRADEEGPEREVAGLEVVLDVAGRVATATAPESAVADALETLCGWGRFAIAHVYRVTEDGAALEPLPVWHAEPGGDEDYAGLRSRVDASRPTRGEGIAGRALHSRRVVWVTNLTVDPTVEEEWREVMPGLQGGCAVPVSEGGAVRAVLVFYARRPLAPDVLTGRVLEAAGTTLGRSLPASV